MTKQIWTNYFDIVLLPSPEITEYAIELSRNLRVYGTKWTLTKNSFIPHISLYHIAVKPDQFNAFKTEVERIIKNFSPGYLQTTVIEEKFLSFDKPDWIAKLYLQIIKRTVKYYDWDWGTNDYWPVKHFSEGMQKIGMRYMKEYGSPMVGRNFKPHISLTSFEGDHPNLGIKKAKEMKFKPSFVFICELGPSHSCQRIVERFHIKNG